MLLSKAEINLIMHSKIIDDYIDIKLMLESEEKIEKDTLDKYLDIKKRYTDIFFNQLLKGAIQEWSIDLAYKNEQDEDKVFCELCGHKDIKRISRIINQFNGNTFILGSSCIKKFEFKNRSDYWKVEKDQIKMRRLVQLDQETGINEVLKNWTSVYKNSPVLIPSRYKLQVNSLIEAIDAQCEKYIKASNVNINDQDKIIITDINQLIRNVKQKCSEIESYYVQTNQTLDVRVARRSLVDYLYRNQNEVFKELEQSGEITWAIAVKIKFDEWLKEIISPLNQKLEKYELNLLSVTGQNQYAFQYKNFGVDLISDTCDFLSEVGGLTFKAREGCTQELIEPDVKQLISNSHIRMDEASLESILYSIPKDRIKAQVEDYYIEFNEVFFEPYQANNYRCVPIKVIFNLYKDYILNNKVNEFYKNMQKIISDGKIFSKSDYKYLSRRRKYS